jgi:hypothetical protein
MRTALIIMLPGLIVGTEAAIAIVGLFTSAIGALSILGL